MKHCGLSRQALVTGMAVGLRVLTRPLCCLLLHLRSHASIPFKKRFCYHPDSYPESTISSSHSSITISEVVKEPTKAEVQKRVTPEDDGE